MRLLVFNPENDLALAHGTAYFTPPASAVQMARDLQGLPHLWQRGEGDWILHLYEAGQTLPAEITEVLPWGWSPLLVAQLRRRGVSAEVLPTDEEMADYRTRSSRRVAVENLERAKAVLQAHGVAVVGDAAWCESEEEVVAAHRGFGETLLKAPWSGSGRGLHPLHGGEVNERDRQWIRRTLARQGGVTVERFCRGKLLDFALEFWADRGEVSYLGLSVFHTTPGGVYAGNVVADEDYKMGLLRAYISCEDITKIRDTVTALLQTNGPAPWYVGPVGVDMMVCRLDHGGEAVHPFVEMNQRCTMGWVALQIHTEEPMLFQIGLKEGRYGYFLSKMEV